MKRFILTERISSSGFSTVVAWVSCFLGAASILVVSWRYGLGVSIDGAVYLTVGRQILEGGGVTDMRGDPLVLFPPLYPLLLAVAGVAVSSLEKAALGLHIVLYAGNYLLSAAILARLVSHRIVLPAFLTLLLVSRTFLLYHYYVLSEPLFILLTLGMLLTLLHWIEEREKTQLLVLAAILAALSCLTRYIGIANIAAGALIVTLYAETPSRKFKLGSLYALGAGLPLVAWLVRNAMMGGSLTGDRLPSPYPLLLNIELIADQLSRWFVPDEIRRLVRLVLAVATATALAVVLFRTGRGSSGLSTRPWFALVVFVVVHVVALVAANTIFAQDYINTRFVMPVYVPIVILMAVASASLVQHGRTARALIFGSLAILICVQGVTAIRSMLVRHEYGVGGYTTQEWKASAVMAFARDHADSLSGGDLYSNAADGVFYGTGLVADYVPDRLNPRWRETFPAEALTRRMTLSDLRSLTADSDREVILVWFDIAERDPRFESMYLFNQYEFDDLLEAFRLDPLYQGNDGGVYRVRLRSG